MLKYITILEEYMFITKLLRHERGGGEGN